MSYSDESVGVMTPEGEADLRRELDNLLNVERPKNKEELALARSQGDLSENADYDAARNRQGEIEDRIKEIRYQLDNYKVVEKSATDEIQIGSTVTVVRLDKSREQTFKIVGSSEVDLNAQPQKIANNSPLAKAVLGHRVGEEVTVPVAKTYRVRIQTVR